MYECGISISWLAHACVFVGGAKSSPYTGRRPVLRLVPRNIGCTRPYKRRPTTRAWINGFQGIPQPTPSLPLSRLRNHAHWPYIYPWISEELIIHLTTPPPPPQLTYNNKSASTMCTLVHKFRFIFDTPLTNRDKMSVIQQHTRSSLEDHVSGHHLRSLQSPPTILKSPPVKSPHLST